MVLERKTLYGVLEALDSIFSPDSTKFSDYVKSTSDDNGFLRTAFCKKKKLLKDRPISKDTTHIVIGCNREIYEEDLICTWTDEPVECEEPLIKLQICFATADAVAEKERWTVSVGYPICYIVELTSGEEDG